MTAKTVTVEIYRDERRASYRCRDEARDARVAKAMEALKG
jgi:hypothetical protein